jgi:SAM-dependent methyltransferase
MSSDVRLDLERIVPDTLQPHDETERTMLEIHQARYEWAAKFVQGKRVLDLACGVGYGSAILAKAGALEVVGVDIDARSVEYAKSHYGSSGNVKFVQSDGTRFQDDAGFDVVVSLETLEHVPEPMVLLHRFHSLLKPGGTLIASAPVTLSSDVNVYHLHDFTETSFVKTLAEAGFKAREQWRQIQPFSLLRILSKPKEGARRYDMRPRLPLYYAMHPAMLLKRVATVLRYGFTNRYLVVRAVRA